jgi:hypothetical protein
MLCYRLHNSWIGLKLLYICLHLFMAGGRLLAGFLENLCLVVDPCHDVRCDVGWSRLTQTAWNILQPPLLLQWHLLVQLSQILFSLSTFAGLCPPWPACISRFFYCPSFPFSQLLLFLAFM